MKKMTFKDYLILSSMLFGMFFGAGNLIFPVYMGQLAGRNLFLACLGFCMTGVGLPLLGIMAIGSTRSEGLFDLSSKVNKWFGYFFTCALYLSIGPLFAIPRTATVSFAVGIAPYLKGNQSLALFIFSLIFFSLVLFFSLRPSKLMDLIGKYINPIFLVLLLFLFISVLNNPLLNIRNVAVSEAYLNLPFFTGLIKGYDTMDALASLAFGIILVNAIRGLGVNDPKEVAKSTIKAGFLSVILMGIIYFALAYAGGQSIALEGVSSDGGRVLFILFNHYFGTFGSYLLALIMIFACLKTSIGLVTSCSTTFINLFPKFGSYKLYAIVFSLFSLVIANFGLDKILQYSVSTLMFLYPLTIVLIFLSIFGFLYKHSKIIYNFTIITTMIFCLIGFFKSYITTDIKIINYIFALEEMMPFYNINLPWLVPSLGGFILGLCIYIINERRKKLWQ